MKALIVSSLLAIAPFAFAADEQPGQEPTPTPPAQEEPAQGTPAPSDSNVVTVVCQCTGDECEGKKDVTVTYNKESLRVDMDSEKFSFSGYASRLVMKEKNETFLMLGFGKKAHVVKVDANNRIESIRTHRHNMSCEAKP
ncbi:MAG: hypothetical protein KF802_05910 [Bdellovibrionaceae bacterium]|nr:hypothetical protein [Pseudobdellovibrionaceae bacterium]